MNVKHLVWNLAIEEGFNKCPLLLRAPKWVWVVTLFR